MDERKNIEQLKVLLDTKTKQVLLQYCKDLDLKGFSSLAKPELIDFMIREAGIKKLGELLKEEAPFLQDFFDAEDEGPKDEGNPPAVTQPKSWLKRTWEKFRIGITTLAALCGIITFAWTHFFSGDPNQSLDEITVQKKEESHHLPFDLGVANFEKEKEYQVTIGSYLYDRLYGRFFHQDSIAIGRIKQDVSDHLEAIEIIQSQALLLLVWGRINALDGGKINVSTMISPRYEPEHNMWDKIVENINGNSKILPVGEPSKMEFQQIIEREVTCVLSFLHGYYLYKRGRFNKAQTHFENARSECFQEGVINGEYFCLLFLGNINYLSGDFGDAKAYYRQAMAENHNDTIAITNLGRCFWATHEKDSLAAIASSGFLNRKDRVRFALERMASKLSAEDNWFHVPVVTLPAPIEGLQKIEKDNNKTSRETADLQRAFSEGLAAFMEITSTGNQWGFVDTSGRKVIPPIYEEVGDFSEGLAVVRSDHQSGYIDRSGKVIVPLKYYFASNFSKGVAVFSDGKGLYGFVSLYNGKYVYVPPRFQDKPQFNGEVTWVKDRNGDFIKIDKSGKQVSRGRYSKVYLYRDGIVWGEKDFNLFVMDKDEKILAGPWKNRLIFKKEGSFIILKIQKSIPTATYSFPQTKTWYEIYSEDGRRMSSMHFEQLSEKKEGSHYTGFIEGFPYDLDLSADSQKLDSIQAPLLKKGNCEDLFLGNDLNAIQGENKLLGYVDRECNVVIPFVFQKAFAFQNKRAQVVKNGRLYYIDRNGNCVKDCN